MKIQSKSFKKFTNKTAKIRKIIMYYIFSNKLCNNDQNKLLRKFKKNNLKFKHFLFLTEI